MTGRPDHQSGPRPLPPGTTSVLHGSTFALSDENGDVLPDAVWGVFHDDTRMLSEFSLEVDGRRPFLLSGGKTAPHAARFFTALRDDRAGGLSIQRRRIVVDDLLEDITIRSHRTHDSRVVVRIRFGADFADLFEVKEDAEVPDGVMVDHGPRGDALRFRTARAGLDIRTHVSFSERPSLEGGVATYTVGLPAKGTWTVRIRVSWQDAERSPDDPPIWPEVRSADRIDEAEQRAARDFERWAASFPVLRSGSDTLVRMYGRSIEDLAALRLHVDLGDGSVILPAAGLPWFMTIFGRDTLITAYEALPFAPELAAGALRALASLQGEHTDDRRDEEPGKVLHEIRSGPLTISGERPYDPYYGSVDATPLWLILLSEYERWTADEELVHRLWANATRALAWIDGTVARSATGYLDYRTRSSTGLVHQGWKDSWDAIRFHDGTLAEPPVALSEVQGYVFDAWVRTADLAGRILGDRALERALLEKAAALRSSVDRDLWVDERGGYYALGLDADGRRIDAMTSNMGHLLWSGVVPDERVPVVEERLFSPGLWSGWGVRTLSTDDAGYDPIGYHVGSVWPHDNALIADGLARAGRWRRSRQISEAMVAAAGHQDHRLPEAFAGYDRAESLFPVSYPMASSPQAWATAATFVWIRSLLGLRGADTLTVTPREEAEEDGAWIHLEGLAFRGERYDVRIPHGGTPGAITPADRGALGNG